LLLHVARLLLRLIHLVLAVVDRFFDLVAGLVSGVPDAIHGDLLRASRRESAAAGMASAVRVP
jgi:hypothetical protein